MNKNETNATSKWLKMILYAPVKKQNQKAKKHKKKEDSTSASTTSTSPATSVRCKPALSQSATGSYSARLHPAGENGGSL